MKNNLESARSDWYKEEMWADIEQHLPPVKEPRRLLPIWWLSGFVTLGLIALSIFFWNKNEAYNATHTLVEIEKRSINKTDENTTVDKDGNSLLFENTTSDLLNSINQNSEEESVIKANSITPAFIVKQLNKSNANSNKHIVNMSLNSSTTQNEVFAVEENNHSNNTQNVVSNDLGLNSSKDKNTSSVESGVADLKKSSLENGKSTIEQMIDKHNTAFLQARVFSIKPLDGIMSYLSAPVRSSFILNALAETNNIINPIKMKWLSSLALYGSYSLLNRALTNTSNDNTLFAQRNEAEKTLEGIGAQLSYRIHFNNNLFTEIGVEYQRINEVLNFEERIATQELVPSDSAAYFINFAGETQYVAGEKIQTRLMKTGYSSYNEHHFVNVPIRIGYSQKFDNFSLSILAGPVLNVYQSYHGDVIGSDLKFVQDAEINGFQNSLFTAFDTGLYLDYNLGKNFSLSGGINYRKSLSSFTIDGVVNQTYDTVDFKLGILFKI
ncbi:hypothetical protein N9176_01110 [bacterium]|nr:hypothetical protein [bacterium]